MYAPAIDTQSNIEIFLAESEFYYYTASTDMVQ